MIKTPDGMSVKYITAMDEAAGTVMAEGFQRQSYTYKIVEMSTDCGIEELRSEHRFFTQQVAPVRNAYEKFRAMIFVAGPYSHGDQMTNVRNALSAANELKAHGFAPYVPHLTHFWELEFPQPYEFWCDLAQLSLTHCNGLLRLPGYSPGTEQEVKLAAILGIPIFNSVDHVVGHFDNLKQRGLTGRRKIDPQRTTT